MFDDLRSVLDHIERANGNPLLLVAAADEVAAAYCVAVRTVQYWLQNDTRILSRKTSLGYLIDVRSLIAARGRPVKPINIALQHEDVS